MTASILRLYHCYHRYFYSSYQRCKCHYDYFCTTHPATATATATSVVTVFVLRELPLCTTL